MKLLHNNVIVKLDQKPEETVTDSGLVIPDMTAEPTEGGSMRSVVDEQARWTNYGTVVEISPKVVEDYKDYGLNVGSRVRVAKVGTSVNHYYFPDFSKVYQGYVLVNIALIESIEDNASKDVSNEN